ncbi:MAG: hypothetical protein ACD_50C00017G0002 [uncultured bacterium]|nr:MAG: hypothetical protein ACD_50C00017G0002 [uncultured bacterium]OGH14550.1 MAG: hypothetical protein A2687_00840 [Candidatus Levybacteria bacterium RIFCSPHIGHO2_01_FULL_38_26]
MHHNISLAIRNKQRLLFDGTVKAVSSYNDRGFFDILPEHQNFISLIRDKIIIHKDNIDKEEIKINKGVLRVYKNKVEIYVGV